MRLSQAAVERLNNATRLLGYTQAQVIEEALVEFCVTYKLNKTYEMHVLEDGFALVMREGSNVDVLEVAGRNGVPSKKVAEKYVAKYQAPVSVIEEKRR